MATPNRFSLAAEPHVGVWGVGWLPRAMQAPYVQRRTRDPYKFVKLLGPREVDRLFRLHSRFSVSRRAAQVPADDIRRFSRRRSWLGHAYNFAAANELSARGLGLICPFFHVTAVKDRERARDRQRLLAEEMA